MLYRLLLAWLIDFLCACSSPDDEVKLRQAIATMEEAGEAGEIGRFMEFVAEDFVGSEAGMARADLRRLLLLQLRRNARVSALVSNVEVELFEDRATLNCLALLTGGPSGWLPDRGQLYVIETGWRKEGGDWLLIQANWQPQL